MNGRRNEELNSDGRRADSDHHVVSDGVRLDIQPHLVEFIPDSDNVWRPDSDNVQRPGSDDRLNTGDLVPNRDH